MNQPRPLRIFLVYQLRLLRDTLGSILQREPTFDLTAMAWRDGDIEKALDRWPADLVLLDSRLGPLCLQSLLKRLRSRYPSLKIVPLGQSDHRQILDLIEAGASGFLEWSATLSQLRHTIHEIQDGRSPCSHGIAGAVLDRIVQLSGSTRESRGLPRQLVTENLSSQDQATSARPRNQHLTAREQDVLALVAVGLQNKEIARRLEISVATVKNHVHRILEKLGVSRRREAIRLASDQGLIQTAPKPEDL